MARKSTGDVLFLVALGAALWWVTREVGAVATSRIPESIAPGDTVSERDALRRMEASYDPAADAAPVTLDNVRDILRRIEASYEP